MTTMALIETHALSKTFAARGKAVHAVRGIDLEVRAGEIFGFLGPNGAGKTTTMRMLATLLPPSGGRATVAGHDLLREPGAVRRRIGYVGQKGGADDTATGRENLVLQGRLYGMRGSDARCGRPRCSARSRRSVRGRMGMFCRVNGDRRRGRPDSRSDQR